jgi:hypothetical protein
MSAEPFDYPGVEGPEFQGSRLHPHRRLQPGWLREQSLLPIVKAPRLPAYLRWPRPRPVRNTSCHGRRPEDRQ